MTSALRGLALSAIFAVSVAPMASAEEDKALDHVFTEAPTDHATGDADAPHTLIVYASNMCPHCQGWFADEWPTLKTELVETGKLRVVFRPLPSEPVQLSMIGFMIAECAPADDYFAVIEHQFERQSAIHAMAQTGGLREEFAAIGEKAGLADEAAMNACLGDAEELADIHLAGERASAGGIRGIPGFILNGEVMKGAHKAVDIIAAVTGAADG